MTVQEGGSGSGRITTVAPLTVFVRPAQLGDVLGSQFDPPGTVSNRLNPVKSPRPAPSDHGRHVSSQQLRHGSGRIAPVASLACRTEARVNGAAALDPVRRAKLPHDRGGE